MDSPNIISLLIPTRNRVESLRRLFQSIEETCKSTESLEVLLSIDNDDTDTIRFVEEYSKNNRLLIKAIIGNRGKGYIDLHKKVTELCHKSSGRFLFFLADDVQFMNDNWDEKMQATYNNAYRDNIYWIRTAHGEASADAQCMAITRDWYSVTGHLGTCYQQDTEFNYVAKHVGREVFLKDIVVIHHRADYKTGIIDGVIDQTFVEGRMAADSGLLQGTPYYSPQVQASIITDSIKLLKRIKSLDRCEDSAKTSAKIRSLYWRYIKIKLLSITPSPVKRIIRWVMKK